MDAEQNEQPVAVLVGMIETMLKRSEQYRREAEEDGDLNDGEKHARVSSVLKELARLGKGLGAAAAKQEKPSSADRGAFDSSAWVGDDTALLAESQLAIKEWWDKCFAVSPCMCGAMRPSDFFHAGYRVGRRAQNAKSPTV